MAIAKLVPTDNKPIANEEIIAKLKYLLEKAEKGELEGLLYVADVGGSYEMEYLNMGLVETIALANRLQYGMQLQWDELSQ